MKDPKEMKTSRYACFTVTGCRAGAAATESAGGVTLKPLATVQPGSRRASGQMEMIEVPSDALAHVMLDNGFELWMRADDLMQDAGRKAAARDGSDVVLWDIGDLALPAAGSRGVGSVLGLATRVVEFFGVDIRDAAESLVARRLGDRLETRLLGRAPGLYRCRIEDAKLDGKPLKPFAEAPDKPLLIFLHGTMSSFAGSFGKLAADDNAPGGRLCARLAEVYGARTYAFEHRTLTESPVQNALALAEALPENAELHLVSHSRGGLVGELLCLAQRERSGDPLRPEVLRHLFTGDLAIAQQLNIEPLDEEGEKRLKEDYAADRERLVKLAEVLDRKRFRITRFVRVACPALGTTLASGRLDRWFSLLFNLGLGGGLKRAGWVPEVLDFLAAVVKKRTDPRVLPGIEAMMPGSAVIRLLNHPETRTEADLTVIAGDVERGDSIFSALKVFVTDWFYRDEHDLVVNTGSMFGGMKRPEGRARQLLDRGSQVNHFSYFGNARSVDGLLQGLTRADSSEAGFRPIAERPPTPPAWRSAIARSRSTGYARPLAVLLPGTMGSSLRAGDERIWLEYGELALGGLGKIGIGAPQVEVDGLIDRFYAPLLIHLAQTHRVEFFAYDWRRSILEAGRLLADQLEQLLPDLQAQNQPLHLVAHSMGGLVVRAMMVDAKGADVWRRICEHPNSKVLMLGTPNHGSHEAVRWLTGRNPTQFRLMLLDLFNSRDGIVDIVRRYPGLVELLPFSGEADRYDDPALWAGLNDALGERWNVPEAATLQAARRTWNRIASAVDPRHMIYVAGVQDSTVCGHELVKGDAMFDFSRSKLAFPVTPEGDGTVTWASGHLPDVPIYYAESTAHDELCARDFAHRTFAGYTELLLQGRTTRLPQTRPAARSASGVRSVGGTWTAQGSTPPVPDCIPTAGEVSRFTFGPGSPERLDDDVPRGIEIQITHGDLCYVKHPLMVGHYIGDSIVSAERALDRQLMHAGAQVGPLTQRMDLGLYPGLVGSSAVFYNTTPDARPVAALIVGLGELGTLTPGRLEASVTDALLGYCLELVQIPEERCPMGRDELRAMGLSTVLIGSGAGGMSLRDSIEALLRAVVTTNRRLMDARLGDCIQISQLQLVELFQDVAINAAEALEDVMASVDFGVEIRWPERVLHVGEGGRRRVRYDGDADWWHRLEISTDEGGNRLRFVSSTNRARAEETIAFGQLALAERFIERASAQSGRNREAARTLFDMLLPNRLKELAPDNHNLVLLLDEKSAAYPWELMEDRWTSNPLPPAARSGLLRTLKTTEFRAQPAHGNESSALVIGNPDLEGWEDFIDLPGAREEAQHVAEKLSGLGYQTLACIDAPHTDILENLHKRRWRILHLAGHGEHEYVGKPVAPKACDSCGQPVRTQDEPVSGMVIGNGVLLTPGDVEQMRSVPELVFINCCHLGKTLAKRKPPFPSLAANLGVQFIRMGVKAVVAAGWAVDDDAANTFATEFYERMLAGDAFGDAVLSARRACIQRHPHSNTFGAYQCYGDPGFRLLRRQSDGLSPMPGPAPLLHSAADLLCQLENMRETVRMRSQDDDSGVESGIEALLERVPDSVRADWLKRADVLAALGFLWGEAGDYPRAIECMEDALTAAKGSCPLKVVEQCSNFRVREAARRWSRAQAAGTGDDALRETIASAIRRAVGELDLLLQRARTPERLNLAGAACKRLVLVTRGPERTESLASMARYYREALRLDTDNAAYPFTNGAFADLFAAAGDPAYQRQWSAQELPGEIERVLRQCESEHERNPAIWLATGIADCRLLRRVTEILQGDGEVEGAPDDPLLDAALSGYHNAFRRGASLRERASISEHLEFILSLLEDLSERGAGHADTAVPGRTSKSAVRKATARKRSDVRSVNLRSLVAALDRARRELDDQDAGPAAS